MRPFPRPPRPCEESRKERNETLTSSRRSRKNHGEADPFEPLTRVAPGCVRFLLHNVNGIGFVTGQRSRATVKLEKLKKILIENNFSYAALTEVNKDWRKTCYRNSIWGATSSWFEQRRVQTSHNTTQQPESEYQVGGTISMAMGELVYRVSSQGSDPRRLGRWSNMTVTGKNDLSTTIITCYCPVKGTCTGSAYVQHLKYMADHRNELPEDMECPRQLLGHDLKQYIDSLQNLGGHQIIVMGDFNSEYSELEEWMMDLGLINLLKAKYGSEGPRTCSKSKDSPIDCIFGSPHLLCQRGGILSFG